MKSKIILNSILIGLLSLVSISLVTLMIYLINNNDANYSFDLYFKANYKKEISNNIDSFDIQSSIPVVIKNSKDNIMKIESNISDDYEIILNEDSNKLNINVKSLKKCVNTCKDNKKMNIYVPKEKKFSANVKSISSDVVIGKFKSLNANINLTKGDLVIDEIKNLNAKTNSGDIVIKKISPTRDNSISTDSGDVVIANVVNANIEATSDNGDIVKGKHKNNYDHTLFIKTVSGDIIIK